MLTNGKWGNARRKLEDQLTHTRTELKQLEEKELSIVAQLRQLDEAVNALNSLPEGVIKLLGLKLPATVPHTNGHEPILEVKDALPQVDYSHLKKVKRNSDVRILDALRAGFNNLQDISNVTGIHFTQVSKDLNELMRDNKVTFSKQGLKKVWTAV